MNCLLCPPRSFSTWKVSPLLSGWSPYPDSCWWCRRTQPAITHRWKEEPKAAPWQTGSRTGRCDLRRSRGCREQSPWSRRRRPRPFRGRASGNPSAGGEPMRDSFTFSHKQQFVDHSYWIWSFLEKRRIHPLRPWTLTTWVSLEALATASPRSEKYLNDSQDTQP